MSVFDHRALTDQAGPLLTSLVAAGGGELRRSRPRQVTHRPGRCTTALHEATVAWRGAPAHLEQLVLHAGRLPAGAEPVAVADDGTPLAAWVVPADPALPALAAALDPERMGRLLADLGRPAASARPRLVAYRPTRRAVVEVLAPGARLFVKVVPPAEVEALHRRHRLLEGAVPVPRSAGYTDDGLVVLEAIEGRTLRQALAVAGGPVPSLAAIEAVLDDLPATALELPGVVPPAERAREHAGLVSDVMPEATGRLEELAARLAATADDDPGPTVAAHGDLYEAQLVVDGGRVTGLLDVDGTGAGHRIDDIANLVGHLSVLERAGGGKRASALGRAYLAAADASGRFDPAALRRRVAAVVLGLATGCFRVQQTAWQKGTHARLDLVEAWLDSAQRVSERDLSRI